MFFVSRSLSNSVPKGAAPAFLMLLNTCELPEALPVLDRLIRDSRLFFPTAGHTVAAGDLESVFSVIQEDWVKPAQPCYVVVPKV